MANTTDRMVVNGAVYEIMDAVARTGIETLNGDVEQIKDTFDYYISEGNLFNAEGAIAGYYYQGDNQTPTLYPNNNYCCYLAEVEGGATYIMNFKDYQVDSFDENKELIREEYFSANTPKQIADNAKYLTISIQNAHRNSYMLIKGTSIPASYVGFGTKLTNDHAEALAVKADRKIDTFILQRNLFDKNSVIQNNYYQGGNQTPTLHPSNNYCCYLAEIYDDQLLYSVNYRDYQSDAFDENKQLLGEVYFNTGPLKAVPKGTKYISISVQKAHLDDFMLVAGEIPESYIDFGVELKNSGYIRRNEISPSGETVYHVGTGQTYTQLIPLLRSLASDSSQKTIYIHEGTYNIFNEYGGADYVATLTGNENWADVSVFIPPNTKLIGIGTVVLSFEPTAAQIGSDNKAKLFSVLNVKSDVYVENVTLKGKNCRYCIHDESSGQSDPGVHHIYKNVKCVMTQDTYGNSQCFGGGFQNPVIFDFDECRMESWSIPFSIHNGDVSSTDKGTTINMRNCYFQSTISSVSVSFRNNTSMQLHDVVNISNCFIGGQYENIEVTASGNTSYPNSFDVTMIGCNAVRGKEDVTPTNIYPITQINSIGTV